MSISEVNKCWAEQTVEAAEASLSELQDATSKVSARLLPDLRQEIEPELLSEVSIVLAAGNANMAKVMANQATITGQQKRKKPEKESEGRRKRSTRSNA